MERNTLETRGLHSQSLVKRASSLHVVSRTLFESLRSGSFKSIYKGRGIEFSGVREYFLGDDVRSIDWNVTARMGRPFVKQFEEDRELVLFVVVDASLSMNTGGGKLAGNRLQAGCEVAALMALAASLGGGSVGGVIFDGDIRYSHKPRAGNNQALMFLNQLDGVLKSVGEDGLVDDGAVFSTTEKGSNQLSDPSLGSNLHKALRGAASLLKKRALVLVISDFRTAGYQQDLAVLASRHDVVAVRIADPVDGHLEGVGSLPFVDPESGYRQILPTSSSSFQQGWKDADKKRVERWNAECYRRGAWPLTISTQEDVAVALQRFFSGREM